MGTNEENIIENFVCLSKVELEPDLYTGSGSDQKVPAPTGSGSATLYTMTSCRENQSLVTFLSESGGGGAGGRAQLDRETAHFILSEAMIRTLEQISFDNK